MICDFCSAPNPTWRYPAETYVIEELQARSLNDWLACADCARLIETNQWRKLAERSLQLCPTSQRLIEIAGYDQALAEVLRMHRGFNRHRIGRTQVA